MSEIFYAKKGNNFFKKMSEIIYEKKGNNFFKKMSEIFYEKREITSSINVRNLLRKKGK